MTEPDQTIELRRRQRSRAILMGIGLFGFVILIYFITIARMAGR